MEISINNETCIRCGHCAVVCPAHIFQQPGKREPVSVVNPQTCIVCGHCVDACPTDSISHSAISLDTLHDINYDNLPSPEQLMELIHARRSNRSMTDRPVPQEAIDMMTEAALYAPTAANNRGVEVVTITDREQTDRIIRFTLDTFSANADALSPVMRKVVAHLRDYYEQGGDPILRNAKSLMLFTSDHPFGAADANLAYQNASLMAQSLGVSQVYMGYVCSAIRMADPARVAEVFGTQHPIHAVMAFGLPAFRYKRYTER
ncbi:MAG: nitroreductase family protein [Prevotella sp.]|nr:nitroreductase family protein [Prevotella sp.]